MAHLKLVRREAEEPTTDMVAPVDSLSESRRAHLRLAINQLPEEEGFLIREHYFEGRPLEEIAEDLDMDETELSQLHAKALLLLRRVAVAD